MGFPRETGKSLGSGFNSRLAYLSTKNPTVGPDKYNLAKTRLAYSHSMPKYIATNMQIPNNNIMIPAIRCNTFSLDLRHSSAFCVVVRPK